jgi:phosphohistidine phosphatase SixA
MYLLNNLIALDQLVNAILGGAPDETLSSRAYRTEQTGKIFGKFFRPVIDGVFFWQKQHCYKGYLSEVQRRQLPNNF